LHQLVTPRKPAESVHFLFETKIGLGGRFLRHLL